MEPVEGSCNRVMVTQYYLSFYDFLTPPSNEYQFFVKTFTLTENAPKEESGLVKLPYHRAAEEAVLAQMIEFPEDEEPAGDPFGRPDEKSETD